MTTSGGTVVMLGTIAAVALASPGCVGEGSATAGSAGSSHSGGSGGTGAADPGAPGGALVSCGGYAKSASFEMVLTLGQSTQNQGRTSSASYVMRGGLIGATGSFE